MSLEAVKSIRQIIRMSCQSSKEVYIRVIKDLSSHVGGFDNLIMGDASSMILIDISLKNCKVDRYALVFIVRKWEFPTAF